MARKNRSSENADGPHAGSPISIGRRQRLISTMVCVCCAAVLSRWHFSSAFVLVLTGMAIFFGTRSERDAAGVAGLAAGLITACLFFCRMKGMFVFLLLLVQLTYVALIIHLFTLLAESQRQKLRQWAMRCWLSGASLCLAALCLEAILAAWSRLPAPEPGSPVNRIRPMPAAWRRQTVEVEGASYAYYWHGILHVNDANGVRRTKPTPPKQKEKCRIIAVGDSFTYGEGVKAEQAFPALLERLLEPDFRVEVLNLGIRGSNAAVVHATTANRIGALDPDIVVYGVCLNDLNPVDDPNRSSGAGTRGIVTRTAKFLRRKTELGRYIAEHLDRSLIALGFSDDFYEAILRNLPDGIDRLGYQISAMRQMLQQNGIHRFAAMVLEQRPLINGKSHKLTAIVEDALALAGVSVIPSEPYFKEYSGKSMEVSPWEQHPNPEAHRIFAENFAQGLREKGFLKKWRRKTPPM